MTFRYNSVILLKQKNQLYIIVLFFFLIQIRWKSDIPLTEGQLKSKRDEFWDTAPAFEGKSEIWNALKAAVEATEVNDYDLAQGNKF